MPPTRSILISDTCFMQHFQLPYSGYDEYDYEHGHWPVQAGRGLCVGRRRNQCIHNGYRHWPVEGGRTGGPASRFNMCVCVCASYSGGELRLWWRRVRIHNKVRGYPFIQQHVRKKRIIEGRCYIIIIIIVLPLTYECIMNDAVDGDLYMAFAHTSRESGSQPLPLPADRTGR